MPAEARALLVDKVVALRQEITDQRTFNECQTFAKPLTRLGDDCSCESNASAGFRVSAMLHEAQVVQLSPDSPTNSVRFANVKRLKLSTKPSAKDIYSGGARESANVHVVDQILTTTVPHRNRAHPFHIEFHFSAQSSLSRWRGSGSAAQQRPRRLPVSRLQHAASESRALPILSARWVPARC